MKKKIRLTETQLIEYIQKTVSKVLTEQSDRKVYQYPNDSNWIYSVENGKWHAARTNREVPKWININDNPAYKVSIERLDKIHPTARAHEQVSGIPLKNSPSHAEENPRYDPRSDGYELPTPGFKDPNRHIDRKNELAKLDQEATNRDKQINDGEEQVSGIPLKNAPSHAEENPRYDPRADGYELPTPGFKDPNRHIERKKALNRLDRNTNAGETELR